MAAPETFDVELVARASLAPSVERLTFVRADGRPLAFAPGQWLSLALPLDGGVVRRSYSIASAPSAGPIELAVTRVEGGRGSTYLCGLPAGARLAATGPQGFFTRDADDPSPCLLVATGTGIAPLRSMLHAALAAGSRAPTRLLLGVRHEADTLFGDELRDLAARHPTFRFDVTLSRAGDAWAGRRGWVQQHVPELWAELAAHGAPHAYVCGLERMVSAVRDVIRKQLGVPRQQVHSERYD